MSNEENTNITQVDIELADLLGTATGANTISQKSNSLFKREESTGIDAATIEKEIADEKKAEAEKAAAEKKVAEDAAAENKDGKGANESEEDSEEAGKEDILTALTVGENVADDEDQKNKGGRKKESKEVIVDVTKTLINDGDFVPFDDEKPLEEYTKEEHLELIRENLKHRDAKAQQEVAAAFYDALPEEFQQAFTYFQNGGKNVKGILAELSKTVEFQSLDEKTEEGQEEIIRLHLTLTNFGDAKEIQEEINDIKDRGQLDKKAAQFKPKLEEIQKKNVERELIAQEARRKQAEKASAEYMDTIYNTLSPGELAGIKLDKKVQTALYNGLVQPNYQSAFTGAPINEMGYLLEQKQFGKGKDHEAVALALWVLRDKEGFLNKVREQGGTQKAKEVAKKLKIEEQSKVATAGQDDGQDDASRNTVKKLKRTNNIFK